jgi:heptosyltransferase-1
MRILIVKLSSLGDVVHTLPAVQDIASALPQARIDWVVERAFAPLVQRCAGVERVIACDLRRWRKAPLSAVTRQQWRDFKADVQRQDYDAIIDVQGLSKSAWVSWLARLAPHGRRYAMAHRTDGSAYEAPTRWVADVAISLERHVHAVHRSRLVCAQALGYALAGPPRYGLQTQATPSVRPEGSDRARPCVVLAHGTSRADKQWPLAHWLELAHALEAAGFALALPHGNDEEAQRSQWLAQRCQHAQVWPRLSLDALLESMRGCAGVIGVDSGLSHMAVALGLAHVQIYNFDTAWRTGPAAAESAGRQVSVYAEPTPSFERVWQAWCGVLAA